MMYITGQGQSVSLGQQIAAGGEGAIFEVPTNPNLVAKLYHKPPDPRKAKKLALMVRLSNDAVLKFAAWPAATLHAAPGKPVVGLLMRRISDARPIHELDTPAHRRANYPRADWRFLIRAARNCAAAITVIHQAGIVIGDVNQAGFLVTKEALVNVIDCDSFQIRTSEEAFLCEVAVPEFLPPELHGVNLATTLRTPNHDAFGLGIIIFRLLMMGRHPFAGYRGRGDKPIPEAVKEYRFAFGPDATSLQMAPPPHSLLLADVSEDVATNFLRSFSRGSERDGVRPTARQWADSLSRLESQMQQCASDPGHYYFSGLRECPWCRIERGSGPNYFISVSIHILSVSPTQIDITPIWSQIVSVPRPNAWLSSLQQALPVHCTPTPLPESFQTQKTFMRRMGFLAAASTSLLLFGLYDPAFVVFMLPVCICIVTVWFLANLNSPHYQESQERRRLLADRARDLEATEWAIQNALIRLSSEFDSRMTNLGNLKDRFAVLQSQEATEVNQLQLHAKDRQLQEYLERFFIKDARLEGIGSGRIATLESYGIETASDATESAIGAVPGFGPVLTERLITWRKALEGQFRFDPIRGLPQNDLLRIRNKYLQMRYDCQRKLDNGRGELARITSTAKSEVERLTPTLSQQRLAYFQAQVDAKVCG